MRPKCFERNVKPGPSSILAVVTIVALTLLHFPANANEKYAAAIKAHQNGDSETALVLLKELANSGHIGAQTHLGTLYEHGRVVSKDDKKAYDWYRKAAGNGGIVAQHKLARLYEDGIGVDQDLRAARLWYTNSALAAEAEGLKRAASFSQYRLALLFLTDKGGEKNVPRAYALAQLASNNGLDQAQALAAEIQATMSTAELTEAEELIQQLSTTDYSLFE
ncbi:tetratricopeptide repeat protein [Labrenzia sp. PHM005]|uniref:tetratricopeptide repeat protein n=1 Tax=Labrenzia sp. PHM005 TaxID=2590016 RepID=UPI00114011B0|nr:tetratricopeptide repeat protein [Labrenzia sp. PHM005]QDG77607.1 sel1 repeat family protein [Labrenzia sp. PHM005]